MKEIKYLKDGGKISLVAPSFGCTSEPYCTRLKIAIENLKKMGYSIDEGKNIFINVGKVASNTPKLRGKEFMDAYLSDSDIVISVGGGELMNEMLPYVNFDKIKKAPSKIFMGFSDPTNLTFTLTTICEVPTIYGVNAPAFAFSPMKNETLDAYNVMTGRTKSVKGYPKWDSLRVKKEDPLEETIYNKEKVIKPYPKKDHIEMEGMIIGGNMDILANIVGTKYDNVKNFIEKYKDDGFIWYMEACDLSVLQIRRAIFCLKEAGWFKYAKGFLIGRPLCFGQKILGVNQYNACKDILKDLNVPILFDVDLGHFEPSMPMINGLVAKVTYKENNIFVDYK